MKIALSQINARVGDIRGNIEKIESSARKAHGLGAELAVFPEQCLAGYPALDLWEDPGFIRANREALKGLARRAGELALLVGFVAENPRRIGKPIHNSAALLWRGRVLAVRHKSLLPTYDVFDEARYFEPAASNPPIPFRGTRLGVTICEDAWAGERVGERRLYSGDPVQRQAREGANVLINISASPFARGKTRSRLGLLSRHARRARRPLVYCNLVGGNDEIVFDGNSLAFDSGGRPIALGRAFSEDLVLVDTEAPGRLKPAIPKDVEEVASALTLGIRDYVRKCGFARVFVGLSGGIDSALVSALAVRALGASHVTGISMPSPYSSPGSVVDARALAKNLGIRLLKLPIAGIFNSYRATLKGLLPGKGSPDLAEQNLQARIRGNLLMALSNTQGGIVLSTGNKSELSVGYCTLYGDMSGGLAVLADVPKQTVYALARWLNREGEIIPRSSIDKPPSAELKPNQKDEDDLPPYEILDRILTAYIEDRLGLEAIVRRGLAPRLVSDILDRIDRNEYKRRQAPPSLKVSSKAFGVGRRMPIARGCYRNLS